MKITNKRLLGIIREELTHLNVMNQLMNVIPLKNLPGKRPWANPKSNKYIRNWIGWLTQEDVDKLGGGQPTSVLKIISDSTGRDITYTVVKYGGTSGDTTPDTQTHVDYVVHFKE
jgi:hypothetical protein